jgi:hypothetical protein
MRKFLIMFAAMFAFGFAGVQDAAAQQNMVGVKGGFISAELSADDFGDSDSRSGFGAGAFLQVMVAPSFSIQPEALYLSKGGSGSIEDFDTTLKLNYLQVPVLVQYHLPTPGPVSPRLFAGPSVAFEVGCDVEATSGAISVEGSCEDADINTKSADFGVVFGGGVDISTGGIVLTLDGRYDLGVTNLDDSPDADAKNRAWEFFAGVGFPFGP